MNRHFFAILLVPLLAACSGGADLSEHDPRMTRPVAVERHAALAVLDVPSDGRLSAFDSARLSRLAAESVRRGAGSVVVESGDAAFAALVADFLRRDGADVSVVEGGAATTLRVSAPIWVAVVPECGTFARGANPDPTNAPNSNWGCAIERNRALMMQNPADLARAREPTGRDGGRAVDVLGKYGRGEATGSAAEAAGNGSVSSVGQSGKK